jgi:hypothetical protein
MATKMLTDREQNQLISDLKECQSIAEDIENAKKAKIEGIEILEQRHKDCMANLQAKYAVYGKRVK